MRSSELTAWFLEDISRWDNLPESSKMMLAKHSPYQPPKTVRKSTKVGWGFTPDYARPPKWRGLSVTIRPRGRPANKTRHESILALADGNRTISQIADILGIEIPLVRSSLSFLRRKGHLTPLRKRQRPAPPTQSRNAAMIDARKEGATLKELSEQFGISVERVRQITLRGR